MFRSLVLLLLLLSGTAAAIAQTGPSDSVHVHRVHPDSVIVDATYVSCGDSTESLLVLGDGRVIYAHADQGVVISASTSVMDDLMTTIQKTRSATSRKSLDSCATLGLIVTVDGKRRYLLINDKNPSPRVKDLHLRIDRIHRMASKRLQGEIDRLTIKADESDQDTLVATPPSLSNYELLSRMEPLLVSQQWHCHGYVVVSVMVGRDGKSRRAFVNEVNAKGKCMAVLAATALRAVLMSRFEPGLNKKCRPVPAWMQVKVPFGRRVGR